jgi:hypothetical protein
MTPVLAYLSNMTEATRDQKLDKKEKVYRIKDNTLRIGDWIKSQDEGRHERFWDYLGHRCFNGSPAKSMRDVYAKMAAERAAKPVANGSANGSSNGTPAGAKKEENGVKTETKPLPAPVVASTSWGVMSLKCVFGIMIQRWRKVDLSSTLVWSFSRKILSHNPKHIHGKQAALGTELWFGLIFFLVGVSFSLYRQSEKHYYGVSELSRNTCSSNVDVGENYV